MSGIPYRASVPKLLPSTVRSCKRGNRAQANASSSSRSAFVHANPVSHLVDAERGLMTGHPPPGRSPWGRSSPRPCWRCSPRSPPGSTAGTSDRYRHRRDRPRGRRRRGPAAGPRPSAAPGAASDHGADRPFPEPLPRWDDQAAAGTDLWATEQETRDQITGFYRRVREHSEATINALPIDAPGHVPWWPRPDVKLFSILVHLFTETSRRPATDGQQLSSGGVGPARIGQKPACSMSSSAGTCATALSAS